jgi:alpha-glutamyl/putrescinyl thymine pyrophosphorylase clade 1
MNTATLVDFICEREAIFQRREAGQPWPWTDDPILRDWSFCNVRREHDRVTRWITQHWRAPHTDEADLWFAMAVARLVNWPATLAELGFPVPWDREHFLTTLQACAARGDKVWGNAYNISNGGKSIPKAEHVASALDALWSRRTKLRPRPEESLLSFYARLRDMDGFASFMSAQVVADVKYVEPLLQARDWWTFAAPGPGSKRGLNRVLGRPVNAPWHDDDSWRAALRKLHEAITPELERVGIKRLHAQDLQNCLCEMDKYLRVQLGEGKPKRRYKPPNAAVAAA